MQTEQLKRGNALFTVNKEEGTVICALHAYGQDFIGEARRRPDEEHEWNTLTGIAISELRANIEMRKYAITLLQYYIAVQREGIEKSIDLFYKDSKLFMQGIQRATEEIKKHKIQLKSIENNLKALLKVA